jgi:hypothetical protein
MTQFGLQRLREMMRGGRAFALVSLLLSVFVLQIGVTRSHFHLGTSFGLAKAAPSTEAPAKVPLGHDEAKCLLWHASGICGSAVPATATVLFLVPPAQTRVAVEARDIFLEPFVSAWRSRAPPSV